MRDKRFVAVHRGGLLSPEDHSALIRWAVDCVHHGIETLDEKKLDDRALKALEIAIQWGEGRAGVGDARTAAVSAHDAARETSNPVKKTVYRACGHAVATAHMADHSLQACKYILKALQVKEMSIKSEKQWQIEHANSDIRKFIQ